MKKFIPFSHISFWGVWLWLVLTACTSDPEVHSQSQRDSLLPAIDTTVTDTPPVKKLTREELEKKYPGRDMRDWFARTPVYTPATSLKPKAQMLEWMQKETLDSTGNRRELKIPVVVLLKDDPLSKVRDVFLGVEPNLKKEDRLRILVDDTFKGIPFNSEVEDYCESGGNWCKLFLVGKWEATLPGIEELDKQGTPNYQKRYPFNLFRVHSYPDSLPQTNEAAMIYFVEYEQKE